MKNQMTIALLLSVFLFGCNRIYKDPNTTEHSLKHDGEDRKYIVHLPEGFSSDQSYPLVLALHGGHQSAEKAAKHFQWRDKADEEGFVVVFPDGLNDHWNDARGTTKSSEDNVDDVGFISDLIDELVLTSSVNSSKVFVTGGSNGGFMTYRLACELSEKITAVAPVIATMPVDQICNPSKVMPIHIIVGTEDVFVPFEGGEMERGAGGFITSADSTFKRWGELNGCDQEIVSKDWTDQHDDGTTVSTLRFEGCHDSISEHTVLMLIEGGGHEWMGASGLSVANKGDGNKCLEIEATDVIWDFFSEFI